MLPNSLCNPNKNVERLKLFSVKLSAFFRSLIRATFLLRVFCFLLWNFFLLNGIKIFCFQCMQTQHEDPKSCNLRVALHLVALMISFANKVFFSFCENFYKFDSTNLLLFDSVLLSLRCLSQLACIQGINIVAFHQIVVDGWHRRMDFLYFFTH